MFGIWNALCNIVRGYIQHSDTSHTGCSHADVTEPPLCSVLDGVQSGGVAYECQGNETRLVDCMITLDTAEIPCFYALVLLVLLMQRLLLVLLVVNPLLVYLRMVVFLLLCLLV